MPGLKTKNQRGSKGNVNDKIQEVPRSQGFAEANSKNEAIDDNVKVREYAVQYDPAPPKGKARKRLTYRTQKRLFGHA